MNRNAKIFVGGYRGMVGSAIVRALRSGGYQRLITRTRSELDLCNQAATDRFFAEERPDYVFLAAALVGGILANTTRPAEFIRVNLMVQTHVIDAAYREGVKKLLFLGSSCIYPKLAPQPMREEHLLTGLLEPTNEPYAVAKIAGLKMLQSYRRQYGFVGISVMPTNLYGPGDNLDLQGSHVVPALIRKFHEAKQADEDQVVVWGTGEPRREFLHVDDLASATLFLMETYDGDEIVNVGCGEDLSIAELAELIRQVVGYGGKIVFDTAKPDGSPRKLLDVSRLTGLGWKASIPLKQGLTQTYEWYRNAPPGRSDANLAFRCLPKSVSAEATREARRALDQASKEEIRQSYDELADRRDRFRRKGRYYYQLLLRHLRFRIPEGRSVLEIGCGDGFVLRRLKPSRGVGCDLSGRMIEKARRDAEKDETFDFVQADIENTHFDETFDFVLMSDLLGDLLDIQAALDNVRSACSDSTRVVMTYHSIFWEGLLKLAQWLRLKSPQLHHNWLAPGDVENFARLSDFEVVDFDRRVLLPKNVPLLSGLVNRFIAPLPLFNGFCLLNLVVLRKRQKRMARNLSTSIIIPCRNERGNIRAAVERLPEFGKSQEILFVDGHSTDGTPEEIQQVISEFPDKGIKFLVQKGTGKGDAVRLGFSKATKDILMILDADLTVPPEDLPKFFDALAFGKGEFINGSRLVYPMEQQAMRFLNTLGNKFFSVVLSWLMNQQIKDSLCGTKVLLRTDYEKIAAGRHYFGDFDPFGDFDLLFGAAKINLKITEIPIRYRERTYGSTNISRFRHGLLLLRMTYFALRKLKTF